MSICHTCGHRALRQVGNFAIWGCLKLRIRFGNETDWRNGVNQPEKCRDYTK